MFWKADPEKPGKETDIVFPTKPLTIDNKSLKGNDKMKKFTYVLTALALMATSPTVHAAPTAVKSFIDIKFTPSIDGTNSANYDYSGAVTYGSGADAVTVGAAGDTWNIFTPDMADFSQTLVTTTNGSAGGFIFSSDGGTSLRGASSAFNGGDYNELMNYYNYVETGKTGSYSISGLTAKTNYNVYVLTQGNLADNGSMLKLTGLNSAGNSETFTQSLGGNNSTSTFVLGQNYMLQTFQTDGDGKLKIDFSSANDHNAIVNSLQVAAIPTPEPASMLLLGIGGTLLYANKLRKKKVAESLVS